MSATPVLGQSQFDRNDTRYKDCICCPSWKKVNPSSYINYSSPIFIKLHTLINFIICVFSLNDFKINFCQTFNFSYFMFLKVWVDWPFELKFGSISKIETRSQLFWSIYYSADEMSSVHFRVAKVWYNFWQSENAPEHIEH